MEFVSNGYCVENDKVIQCNIRDITDRKQAQDALIRSEALLRELSIRDQLTGLYNRRYMEKTLECEIHRANRKHLSLGIVLLDVDHFKHFNDNYGHATGDPILRDLSKMVLRYVRREDIPCRYGGDEMLIVMTDASTEVTIERVTFIYDFAKHYHLQFEGSMFDTVSLSLGIAVFPDHGTPSFGLLKAVDEALYQAKHAGQRQVFVSNSICIVDPVLKGQPAP